MAEDDEDEEEESDDGFDISDSGDETFAARMGIVRVRAAVAGDGAVAGVVDGAGAGAAENAVEATNADLSVATAAPERAQSDSESTDDGALDATQTIASAEAEQQLAEAASATEAAAQITGTDGR